ncbi:MAG TPA: molybdopterin-dependent oxidoreductase [Thermoanaerobaculia bacterium]|jgi:DMSO/TMAO reductase YedYZ molybdopterin-dependent catalytic subunit|nr:molybdopterin-dependent oxidoreductase [Thermoanaerobaculia bacterium]
MTDDRFSFTGLSRRDLLRLGVTAGAASLATACGWQGGPLVPVLQGASRLNDWVGEKLFLSGRHLVPQYPHSARTPEGLFPAYSISRPMLPQVADPAAWALEVGGLVRRPMRLTLEMVRALPKVRYTVKHHCVEGWSAIATWTGAPLASVVQMVEPTAAARYLRFDSFDSGYFNGWDLESAMHPQTILAYAFNDHPLGPAHGAPLRVYSPVKLGYKLTKYLTRMTFTAERPGGYWEDQGYPWLGGV